MYVVHAIAPNNAPIGQSYLKFTDVDGRNAREADWSNLDGATKFTSVSSILAAFTRWGFHRGIYNGVLGEGGSGYEVVKVEEVKPQPQYAPVVVVG